MYSEAMTLRVFKWDIMASSFISQNSPFVHDPISSFSNFSYDYVIWIGLEDPVVTKVGTW